MLVLRCRGQGIFQTCLHCHDLDHAPTGHAQYGPRKPVPKRHSVPQSEVDAARQPQLLPVSRRRGCGRPGELTLLFISLLVLRFFISSLTSGLSHSQDSNYQCGVGSPSSRLPRPIIGAEDDDFNTEQEQVRL